MKINTPITQTESIVAAQYADGASFKEIAKQMGRSPHTVRSHLKNIYRKLGVNSKIALQRELSNSAFRGASRGVVSLSTTGDDWRLYVLARKLSKWCSKESQDAALGILCDLRDRYPDFYGTYAALSFVTGGAAIASSDADASSTLLREALVLAETSLRLNAFDANAHLAMGRALIFKGDFAVGERHIRFALDRDENSEWAQYMSVFATAQAGNPIEAISLGEVFQRNQMRSYAIEPMSLVLGFAYLETKRRDEASNLARSILRRNRAHDLVLEAACAILIETNRHSEVLTFARRNRLQLRGPTPIQGNLNKANCSVADLITKHSDQIEHLFYEASRRQAEKYEYSNPK